MASRASAVMLLGQLVAATVGSAPWTISTREIHADGWDARTAGTGLRVTEGWGYMDQNVLHVSVGGIYVTYGALFFP